MPACPAQVFSNITPEKFVSLEKQAQASGIPIEGNSGSASKFGGQFTWNYDPVTLQLTIAVTQPPFLMSCESVNARISALVTNLAD
jgi:hypothetical protein